MSRRRQPPRLVLPDTAWYCLLAAVTLLAYRPAWRGGLLWDDAGHLIPVTLRSWEGLASLWLDPSLSQQYYPVTTTAFWLIARLFGDEALAYHLTSILLHAGSAIVFLLVLRRLGVPGARLASVIFALHPVHVESVAWISELKNTLSGFWYLLATWWYLKFAEERRRHQYVLAALAFGLALGSKTVTATWPAAMLVIIWWRQGALRLRSDVLPIAPLLAAGVAAGVGTAWLEYHQVGAQGTEFALSWIERGLLAGRTAWFYAASLIWPSPLVFSYPRWTIDASVWWQWLYPVALLLVLVVLYRLRQRDRGPLTTALLFLGTLFPVLGFLNVYPFRYSFVADHFQYHASLAAIAAAAAVITIATRRWVAGLPEWAPTAIVGLPLWLLTTAQAGLYVDAPTLYRHTLIHNPTSAVALTNLASLLLDGPRDGLLEGIALAERSVRHHPDSAVSHNLLGLARLKAGAPESALPSFERAVALDPKLALAQYNRGLALDGLNRLEEARSAYQAALALTPDNPAALNNLSSVLRRLGQVDDALVSVNRGLALDPQSPELHLNLADIRQAQKDYERAIDAYGRALSLRPDWGEAWNNLGVTYRLAGRHTEAVDAFRSALKFVPQVPMVHLSLASALLAAGKPADAVAALEAANALLPGVPELQSALAQVRQSR